MASTARAYQTPQSSPRLRPNPRPDLYVYPGKNTDQAAHAALDPVIVSWFKIALVAVLVLAAVGIFRVWLSATTVSNLIATEELSSQIDSARATGSDLEIQQSLLSNPARIQAIAADTLAMAPTTDACYLDIAAGVLATDSDGTLSLSGSLVVLGAPANEPAGATTDIPVLYG